MTAPPSQIVPLTNNFAEPFRKASDPRARAEPLSYPSHPPVAANTAHSPSYRIELPIRAAHQR